MFKTLRNRRGQGITVQYVMTFFLVLAVVGAISLYVRRAIQARMRDANIYLFDKVNAVYSDRSQNIQGVYYGQYEPYYANAQASSYSTSRQTYQESAGSGGSPGKYKKSENEVTSVQSSSTQAPPGESN